MTDDEKKAAKAAYMREWTRKNAERVNAERRERYAEKKGQTSAVPTKKLCSRCGLLLAASKFYTNGPVLRSACKECERARKTADRATNPEKYKLWDRNFYEQHVEERRQDKREYYGRNKQRWTEYYKKNKATIDAQKAAYLKANPERLKEWKRRDRSKNAVKYAQWLKDWKARNPERARELAITIAERRRCRILNAEGSHTAKDIRALLEKQQFKCVGCGKSIRDSYSVDHIMPLCKGGSNDPSNLQLLCMNCNCRKGRLHPDEWRRRTASA